MNNTQSNRYHRLRRYVWLLAHIPFILVFLILIIGLIVAYLGYWRRGTFMIGGDAILAGLIRFFMKDIHSGLLMVRSRTVDVIGYSVVGLCILVLSATISAVA